MKLENGIMENEEITSFTQVGAYSGITNKSFLLLMENIAGAHSAYCHFSIADLMKQNLTWVILGWKLQVIKRPKAQEKIKIQTWARKATKLFILREFKVTNEKGEILAIASSKWCLVDMNKGKMTRMPENIKEIYQGFHNESVFNIDDISKLNVPESAAQAKDEYKIRRFDLDVNNHVHNLNYLDFAYELLPEDVYRGEELKNVEIMYKREIKYGEVIKSSLYVHNNCYTIVIRDETEEIVHAIVKVYD